MHTAQAAHVTSSPQASPGAGPTIKTIEGDGGNQGWGSMQHNPMGALRPDLHQLREQQGQLAAPARSAEGAAFPRDVSSQAGTPLDLGPEAATAPATAAGPSAPSMQAAREQGAAPDKAAAHLHGRVPLWPGPPGRDNLPLRHEEHRCGLAHRGTASCVYGRVLCLQAVRGGLQGPLRRNSAGPCALQ